MKQLNTLFITLVLVVVASVSMAQTPISLSVDFTNSIPLNKDVLGFNMRQGGIKNLNDAQTLIDRYTELGNPLLRFPGGTVGNYINLVSGRAEYFTAGTPSQKDIKRVNQLNILFDTYRSPSNKLDYNEWIRLVQKTNTRTSYVVNMTSMTIAENVQVIKAFAASGVDIPFFEMGNEVFYNQYKDPIGGVANYIKNAKIIKDSIRKYYPNAKIGVTLDAEYWSKEQIDGGSTTGIKYLEDWYKAIRNTHFYDAVIVHLYTTVGMGPKTSVTDFIPYDEAYKFTISNIDANFNFTIDSLKQDFPGKDIWVTEYGIGGFSNSLSQYKLRDTYLSCLNGANMMLKMFSRQEVKMTCYHAFNNMITESKNAGVLVAAFTPLGQIFKLFNEPVSLCDKMVSTTIVNMPKYQGASNTYLDYSWGSFDKLNSSTFYNDTTGEGYTFIVNKLSECYSLSKTQFANSIGGNVVNCSVFAPDTTNQSLSHAIISKQDYIFNQNYQPVSGNYSIPPYSVIVLKFKKNTHYKSSSLD